MLTISCPSCRKRIHPPEHLAGRRVMCPRCETPIVVPTELVKVVEEAAPAAKPSLSEEEPPFPKSARWGVISLVLGMTSIFLVCAPAISYLSIGLSSLGLLLGLGGLFRARTESEQLPPSIAGGVGICAGFGTRVRDYPLAGVAACLLALLLTCLPMLLQWLSEQWS
jgi:hypothetical protein